MSICILTLVVGTEYRKHVETASTVRRFYAQKFNYTYIEDYTLYDETKAIAWSKIHSIIKNLPNFDYLVLMDADTLIMNLDQTLEEKIEKYGDKDIFLVSDWEMINTGVMFIKNTPFSLGFMERLRDEPEMNKGNWEQDSFIKLYQENLHNEKDHIRVLDYRHEKDIQCYWYAYRWGFFILHFCGYRGYPHELPRSLNKFCMIRLPGELEDSYLARVKWIKEESYAHITRCVNMGSVLIV